MESIEIKDGGNRQKERIVFRPDSNIDLGYYILFIVRKISDTDFSSQPEKVFWFPDVSVKENDIIVVYTKEGNNSTKLNSSGTTTYFFYWGLSSEQFAGEFIPVLVEAKGWIGIVKSDKANI